MSNEPETDGCRSVSQDATMLALGQDTASSSPQTISLRDPFDTMSPDWSYGAYLAAVADQDVASGNIPTSAEMSVLFDDLMVSGSGSGATYQNDLGRSLSVSRALKSLLSSKKEPERTILHGIDGVVCAGEMLLVLGRPGSGCSTLLKTLAGFSEGYKSRSGDVKYNGVDVSAIKKRFRGEVVYNAEVESHFAHLNVGQTLRFAVESRTPGPQRAASAKNQYVRQNTDMLATTFGLRHTLQTKVGDDYVRGVSGGERKRVSLAEVLSTRASVCYWDNPTRGLDASTALELAITLRSSTSIAHTTAIVAAYQAGENFSLMFDKVTLLYSGRQIFFGTLAEAETHFTSLGFYHKARQTTADFLTAITDPTGRRVHPEFEHIAPQSPNDFVTVWKQSKYYSTLKNEIQNYRSEFNECHAQWEKLESRQASQKSKHQRSQSPYIADLRGQFTATLKRSYQRVIGDKAYLVATTFSAVFMSLIIGSVFVNTSSSTAGFFSKGGIMYFSVLFNALQTMSEVSTQYVQRPVVQKHTGFAFYHPFVDALCSIFADYPFKIINIVLFDVIVYFMVGLKREAGAFFIFVLITYLTTLSMSGIFRTVAATTKRVEAASGVVGILVLVLAIYAGYIIPSPSMHPWFRWLRFINPVQYGFEALMVNEFHEQNAQCVGLVPSGPGYKAANIQNQVCAVNGAHPGQPFVSGDAYLSNSFQYEYSHLWRNIGILIGFTLFFILTCAIATEFNPLPPEKGEFLVFREGHEPKSIRKALEKGNTVDDLEQGNVNNVLLGTKTNLSGFHGLEKSKDVFTWEHINHDIPLPGGAKRRLLSEVTGFVKPGTLTALMGESGAGKTTLLNVLARRVDTGVITGERLVNGLPCSSSFQRRTGYVQQQDVHVAESTVREALRFSALLRQGADVTRSEKFQYVESVIEMLEMEDYAEAVIGTPGNGLNVEQRKRTTIGIELVAKPGLLLFLDEPTSGLDSQSAWSIVRLLRKLANSGQAILCTIHQPSSVLFEQFDRLLLLKKGGRTVYFGDIGVNSQDVIDYFESNGASKCAPRDNPAEYILQVIGAGATAKVDRDWGDIWESTPDTKDILQEIAALKAEYKAIAGNDSKNESGGSFGASWITQFKAVQTRVFQIYWRNPDYVKAKLVLNVFGGLFLGFTFWKEDQSIQGMQNRLFAVFMSTILAMPLMNQLQPQWEALTSLYSIREKPSKIYHWSTFVLSNILVEIPFNLIAGTLFFICWYFPIGLYRPFSTSSHTMNVRGIYEWLMLMLFQLWWSTFGQAIGAISPNAQTANILTTLLASFVLIFNGVLQPLSTLIKFWHWMYYISPWTWLIGSLVSNVISGTSITCASKELNIFNPPSGQTCQEWAAAFIAGATGKILNPDATAQCQYCRYATGDEYLQTLNMKFADRWRNLGLMVLYVLFNVGAAFAAFYVTKVLRFDGKFFLTRFRYSKGVPQGSGSSSLKSDAETGEAQEKPDGKRSAVSTNARVANGEEGGQNERDTRVLV